MKVIAQQGERFLIWENRGVPGDLDAVVIVDSRTDEAWRLPLGSALARGYWRDPIEAPTPQSLLGGISITDTLIPT